MVNAASLMIEEGEDAKLQQSESEESDASTSSTNQSHRRVGAGVAAVLLISAVALAARFTSHATMPSHTAPVDATTARRLMDSPELADVMAQNYLSFTRGANESSAMQLTDARIGVQTNLADFCGDLRQHDPNADRGLEDVTLTPSEKSQVLTALRAYGGAWGPKMLHEISDTTHEVLSKGGNTESFKQRLSARLSSVLQTNETGLQTKESGQGDKEMQIQDGDLHDMGFDGLDEWQVQFSVTQSRRLMGTEAKRITSNSTAALTTAQLNVFFGHMDHVLEQRHSELAPEAAPTRSLLNSRRLLAPARQLLFAKQKEEMSKTTGKQRFMACVQAMMKELSKKGVAIKNFMLCLSEHCPLLWSWLSTKFMKLTGKQLTIPK